MKKYNRSNKEENFLSFIKECFLISFEKRKANRRVRIFASRISLFISAVLIAISLSTFIYFWSSLALHIAIYAEGHGGMDGLTKIIYDSATNLKEFILNSSQIAAFLNSCNINLFGKLVQTVFLLVGMPFCSCMIICATKASYTLVYALTENFLVNHRNNWFYRRMKKNFIQIFKSKDLDSHQLRNSRWYIVFYKDIRVQRLLREKLNRESLAKM